MFKTIYGVLYLIISVIFLLPFGVIAFILHFLGLRKSMKLFIYRIAQGWGKSLIKIAGCKAAVSGRDFIPRDTGVCFISNHDSYFDIVLLLAFADRPFGFIAKKELAFVPFLNIWIYMLGGLFIDRKNIRKAVKTISEGAKRIKAGGGMVIFPEGHRSKGRGLLPFHQGSLKLATMAHAPIIPVAIKNTSEVLEKHNRVISANVSISFLPPIDTASLPSDDRKQILCDRIFCAIKDELDLDNDKSENTDNL
jgi:1-acyl-sn-glycerol-3-phosphate acyltransferase